MPSEQQLLDLIGLIYDAALDRSRWSDFVKRYADTIGADSAFIRIFRKAPEHPAFIAAHEMDPSYFRDYGKYYYRVDPFYDTQQLLPIGEVAELRDLLPIREYTKTEWYNDFAKVHNYHHATGGHLARVDDSILRLGTIRSRNRAPFSSQEKKLISSLCPHLQRAMQIGAGFGHLTADCARSEQLLDQLPMGIALLDNSGRTRFINSHAEEVLRNEPALSLRRGFICIADSRLDDRLKYAVRHALLMAQGEDNYSGDEFLIRNEGAVPAFRIAIVPLKGHHFPGAVTKCSPGVALLLCPANQTRKPNPALLSALFDLTPAESRLAIELTNGKSLDEVAHAHQLSKCTVRAQLRSVFGKTGTRRQAELVSRLLHLQPSGGSQR